MYASPCCSFSIELVKSWSMYASELKSTRNASSWRFESLTRSSDAASTAARLSYIEPELSIRIPSDTGTSSCRKPMIVCGTPSSYT